MDKKSYKNILIYFSGYRLINNVNGYIKKKLWKQVVDTNSY